MYKSVILRNFGQKAGLKSALEHQYADGQSCYSLLCGCDGHVLRGETTLVLERDGSLVTVDSQGKVFSGVLVAPVHLHGHVEGLAGKDIVGLEFGSSVAPRDIVKVLHLNPVLNSLVPARLRVHTLVPGVSSDVELLSNGGSDCHDVLAARFRLRVDRARARSSAVVIEAQEVGAIHVGGVNVDLRLGEVALEVSDWHVEDTIIFLNKANLLDPCGGPVSGFVTEPALVGLFAPGVSDLHELSAISEQLGAQHCVSVARREARRRLHVVITCAVNFRSDDIVGLFVLY